MHIFDFFRDIFSVFGAFSRFLGVKFGFRKSCLCKRNDKYEVCTQLSATSETFSYSDQSKVAIVILPLVTLEDQVEGEMTRLGL